MLIRYLKIGVINSILGLIIIMFCVNILTIDYNISYFIGYAIGLINSFVLNKNYTFRSNKHWKKEIIPFILVFIIAYSVSHVILYLLVENRLLNKNIAILGSMTIYTIVGYVLNKKVFTIK